MYVALKVCVYASVFRIREQTIRLSGGKFNEAQREKSLFSQDKFHAAR
jgi:hypothetical protein